MSDNRRVFNVALTADFHDEQGRPRYQDLGMSQLDDAQHVISRSLSAHRPEVGSDQLEDVNGLIVLTPKVTEETVSRSQDLLAIGRFGVGYDTVDVEACTMADVLVFITAGAVDRSVAEATLGWMIALGHRVLAKDRLVRTGLWDTRSSFMGSELRDRTLGIVGLGGIARELLRLLEPFGMNQPLVYDPVIDPQVAEKMGVRLVGLNTLMAQSDYVSLHCPLTSTTRGLIGSAELALMKPSAYLINTARGGIVDESALCKALDAKKLAGAALDCFEAEPLLKPPEVAGFEQVLLAPHCIAWTNELFRDIGRCVSRGMLELSLGRRPGGVINPQVFERPGFKAKWQRLTADTLL